MYISSRVFKRPLFPRKSICPACLGKKKIVCDGDEGTCVEGRQSCTDCGGTGDLHEYACTACDGQGEVGCEKCASTGMIECPCVNGAYEEFLYGDDGGRLIFVTADDLSKHISKYKDVMMEINPDILTYYVDVFEAIENDKNSTQ